MLVLVISSFSYAIEDKSKVAINFYDKYSFFIDALFLSFLSITLISYGLANVMKGHEEDVRKIGYVLGLIMGISTSYGLHAGLFGTFRKLFLASPYFLFIILLFFVIAIVKSAFSKEDESFEGSSLYLKRFAIILGAFLIIFFPLLMGGYGLNVEVLSDGSIRYLSTNNQLKLGFENDINDLVSQSNPYYAFLKFLIIGYNIWQISFIVFVILLLTSLTKMITPEGIEIKQEIKEREKRDKPIIEAEKKVEKADEEVKSDIDQSSKNQSDIVKGVINNVEQAIDLGDPDALGNEAEILMTMPNEEEDEIRAIFGEIKEDVKKEKKELETLISQNPTENQDSFNDKKEDIIEKEKILGQIEALQAQSDSKNPNNKEIINEIEKLREFLLEIKKVKRGVGAANAKIISKINNFENNQEKFMDEFGNFISVLGEGLVEGSTYIMHSIKELFDFNQKNYSGIIVNNLKLYESLKEIISKNNEQSLKIIKDSHKDIKGALNDLLVLSKSLESKINAVVENMLVQVKKEVYEPLAKQIKEGFERNDLQIKKIMELVNLDNPQNKKIVKDILENILGKRVNYLIGINKELVKSINESQKEVGERLNNIDQKVDGISELKKMQEEFKKDQKEFQKNIIDEYKNLKKVVADINEREKEGEKLIEVINNNIITNLQRTIKFTSKKSLSSVYYVFDDIKNSLIKIDKLNSFSLNYYFQQNLYNLSEVDFKKDFLEFEKRREIFSKDDKINKLLNNNPKNIFYSLCLTNTSIISSFQIYVHYYNQIYLNKNINFEAIEKEFLQSFEIEYKEFNKIKLDVIKNIDIFVSQGFIFENLKIIFNLKEKDIEDYYSKILSNLLNKKVNIPSAADDFKKINEQYKKYQNYKLKQNGHLKINIKKMRIYIKNLEKLNNENQGKFSFIIANLKKLLGIDLEEERFLFLIKLLYSHNNKKNYNWLYNNLDKKEVFLVDEKLDIFRILNNYYDANVRIETIFSNLIDIQKYLHKFNMTQHDYFWNTMSKIFNLKELKNK